MAGLQSKLDGLRGQLSVLQEQYAHALFAAEAADTDATRTALQAVETRINRVGAGIFRLSNATNQKLRALEKHASQADGDTAVLRGQLALSTRALQDTDVARADALAEQMDLEVRNKTVAFLYNLVAIGLVGMMAYKLKAPSQ